MFVSGVSRGTARARACYPLQTSRKIGGPAGLRFASGKCDYIYIYI